MAHAFLLFLYTRIFVLVLLLLVAAAAVIAQDDDDVVRVNTDLVVLNVTVTDKSGQYVRNLRASDFNVYEDGKLVDPMMIAGFSMQESPYAAVVLLDSSGSMEARMALARSAAIRFLDGLRDEDVAAVFRFDSLVQKVQDFSGGRDLAPMAYAIRPKGMTTLNDAIVEAARVLADRQEKRKAILVLSDGMDTFSKASPKKAVESALAIGATIYAVDMSSLELPGSPNRQSAMSLKGFAERTGGRFINTPGGPALRDAFSKIADELGHQYTLAYRPANKAHDGKWRVLEVRMKDEGLHVRTRTGYRAPKDH
ncbi:MAG: VWA domain-containing protein [Pyrinomonadaceae bacterium]